MIQSVLQQKLRPLIEGERSLRRRKTVGSILTLGAIALAVLLFLAVTQSWWSWAAVVVTFATVSIAILVGVWVSDSRSVDVKALASKIEDAHPDLKAALLTAVEQQPAAGGHLGYLQERVVLEAVEHALNHNWIRRVSRGRLVGAGLFQLVATIGFGVLLWMLVGEARSIDREETLVEEISEPEPEPPVVPDFEIEVMPGDTEIERGARLIVEARFGDRIPQGAVLVMRDPGEEGAERGRIRMKAGLDESVFSGLITSVDADAVYRVEFEGESSEEFAIATYVHPQLEQADAEITPPAYAERETRVVENVRKVSLLEGSDLEWTMRVNKPIAAAELFGEDESVIPLVPSEDDPTTLVASHQPDETRKYRLHLVDEKDRGNKRPPWFTVTVKRNLPPKLEFVFPKRDLEVSALQEMPVEGKVWDDLGVLKAGATFTFGDESREILLADAALEGGENHALKTLFAMEEIGAQPRDLVAYHLWAEDLGPDGKPRRTASDMFFAEVRYFEDIFREAENMGGQGQWQGQGGGQTEELLKLQKDVMNATWKLIRRSDMGRKFEEIGSDIGVVKDSQEHAIGQAEQAAGEIEDAELRELVMTAMQHMGQAVETLNKSIEFEDLGQLRPAHATERKAYEALIRARSREHDVTRSQNQQQSQGQGQQQQQQLMQLEMEQKELKYEEESQAQDPAEQAQQDANLEVLNRLKELARRQEAIAEKIKELENALEEAETEEEKQELQRQLERLQEEQEQLLRDLDDLGETMDSEENRANMAQEREQLEETRDEVKEASEQLDEGNLAEAANAATRAQREIDEVREEFRKKTSRRFDDEMRDLRRRTRELAENQEEIGKRFEEGNTLEERQDPFSETNSPLANAELARDLENQRQAYEEVVDQLRELSEESEESEPILSSALYDAVREARMGGIDESLEEARDLTRYNRRELAQESERSAARGLEELKEDIEAAAEKVLGSEADAMRLARSELEELIEQTREETERLGGNPSEQEPGEEGTELAMNETGQRRGPDGRPSEDEGDSNGAGREPGDPEGNREEQGEPGEGRGESSEERERQPGEGSGQGEVPGEEGSGESDPNRETGEGQGRGEGENQSEEEGQQGEGQGQGKPGSEEDESASDQSGEGGEGQQPGEGQGRGESNSEETQMAENGQGQQPGQGQGQGQGEGESQSPSQERQGEGQGQGQAEEGVAQGQGQGEGQGRGRNQSRPRPNLGGEPSERQTPSPGSQGGRMADGGSSSSSGFGGPNFGGGEDQRRREGLPNGRPEAGQPLFFQGAEETEAEGPITGGDYEEFANRLRNVESMVEEEDLRNELAKVIDDARAMRIEFRRNNTPPQARSIDQRITMPLVEIRDRLAEELAKLDKENPLAPIDRDPVPREYRELVRRYYEELGSGR